MLIDNNNYLAKLDGIDNIVSHGKTVWKVNVNKWGLTIHETPIRHYYGYAACNQVYEFHRNGVSIAFPDYMIDNLAADDKRSLAFIWIESGQEPLVNSSIGTY